MAFLHQTKFRPACVVSALPKRFRDSLFRELKGAVALSTCPVSELEGAVRRQGATIAVVGVSEGTIEVAERLSHTDRKLKVFLAHYKEGSSALLNGFAGVFNLRAEAKCLAAAIKGRLSNVEPSTFPTAFVAWPSPSPLARFIELQKKAGNPAALSDGILDHLIDLAGGTEGFLLQPERVDETMFRVTATRGEDMPPIGQSIVVDPSRISSPGFLLDVFEEQHLETLEVAQIDQDRIVLPIHSRDQICAIFVCDKIDRSESFDQLLNAASYLFDQVAEREAKSLRYQLLATARSSVVGHAGWMLVAGDGRVIHREGSGTSLFKLRGNRIKESRLQDLVYRSFHGEISSIELQGKKISARTVISDQGLYCLLEIHLLVGGVDENSLRTKNPFQALTVLRSSLAKSGGDTTAAEELLTGLMQGEVLSSSSVLSGLQKLGITVDFGKDEAEPDLVSRLALVLLMASKELRSPINATFRLDGGRWILTSEISEKELGTEPLNWRRFDLLQTALDVAGFDYHGLRTAAFGFQLIGQI